MGSISGDYTSFDYEEEGATMYGSSRKYPSYWGSHGFKLWGKYNGQENENSVFKPSQMSLPEKLLSTVWQ